MEPHRPEIKKILKKNQNGFWRNRSISQFLTIRRIAGVCVKNLEVTLLFLDFSKAFDFIHWGKMAQILLAYGIPKETVIIMLYKNTKVSLHTKWRHTLLWHFAGVLQEDTLAPYLFIICLDYILQTSIGLMKENGFTLKKTPKKQTIPHTNYYGRRLYRWYSASCKYTYKSRLDNLEQAAGDICLHVNADKTECMCFNHKGDISTLNSSSLKLEDKFTYFGSSDSSTENYINMRLAMAWTAIDHIKSDLSDKIKRTFFQAAVVFYYMDSPHGCWLSV